MIRKLQALVLAISLLIALPIATESHLLLLGAGPSSVSTEAAPFTPPSASGLTLWLKADSGAINNLTAKFDGAQFLSKTDNADLSFGNEDFTIAAWVNLQSTASTQAFIGKWDSAGGKREYQLQYNVTDNLFEFFVSDNGDAGGNAGVVKATTFGAPSLSTFYFLVARHDATNNVIEISVNGGTFDQTAWTTGCNDNTSPFHLGATGTTASPLNLLNGYVQCVGIWGKVLSSGEVASLYNSGNGIKYASVSGSLATNLISWWNLGEAGGTRSDAVSTNDLTDNNEVVFDIGQVSGPCADGEAVTTWQDQSGNGFNFTSNDPVSDPCPIYSASGQNGLPTVVFNGTDQYLKYTAGNKLEDLISASSYSLFAVFKADSIGTDEADTYANDAIISDVGEYFGVHLKSAPTVHTYNWDGSDDNASASITTGDYYLVHTRHESGNIYVSVDNGSETSTASGDTEDLTSEVDIGVGDKNTAMAYADISLSELYIYNTAISGTNITNNETYVNGRFALW